MPDNSLVVQQLGLLTLTAEGLGSIPNWGTKIPQTDCKLHSTTKKKRKKTLKCPKYQCLGHTHVLSHFSCVRLFANPMNYSLPGSSASGIVQSRILEWVAISFSKGSSRPRDQTHVSCVSCIGREILSHQCHWDILPKETLLIRDNSFLETLFTILQIFRLKTVQVHTFPATSRLLCFESKLQIFQRTPWIWTFLFSLSCD